MPISKNAGINELRAAAVAGVIADAQAKRKVNESAFVFDPRKTDGRTSAKLSTDEYERLMGRNGEWVTDQELVQIAKADGANLYFTVIEADGKGLTYQAHDAGPASDKSKFYHMVLKGRHYEPFGGYAEGDGNCGLWSVQQERNRANRGLVPAYKNESVQQECNRAHRGLVPAYKNEKELQTHVKAQFPEVLQKLTAKPVAKGVKAAAPVVQEVKSAAPVAHEVKAVRNKPAVIAGTVTGANAVYSVANNKHTLFNYQQIDNERAEQAHAVLQQHDLGTLRELLQQAENKTGEHLTWKIDNLGKQYGAQFGENFFRQFVEGKISDNDFPAGVLKSIESSLKHDCVSALTSEAYRNDEFRGASPAFDAFLGIDSLPETASRFAP